MNRPRQSVELDRLWTLFVDRQLDGADESELADWIARGGKIEHGVLEDLDCHQMLDAIGHIELTKNQFVCEMLTQLSIASAPAATEEAEAETKVFHPLRVPTTANQNTEVSHEHSRRSRILVVAATAVGFIGVAAVLLLLLTLTHNESTLRLAPSPTPPVFHSANLESDPVQLAFDQRDEGPEGSTSLERDVAYATVELEAAIDMTVAKPEVALAELSTRNASLYRASDKVAPLGVLPALLPAETETNVSRTDNLAVASETHVQLDQQETSGKPGRSDRLHRVASLNDEAVVEAKDGAATLPGEVKSIPKVSLTATDDTVWATEPTDIQGELLTLKMGAATIKGDFGEVTVYAPATVFFDLPNRITLQTGAVQVAVVAKTPLMVDTAFGSCVLEGRGHVLTNIDGMSVLAGDKTVLSSAADSWELNSGDHKILTATGDVFDWYAALDLTDTSQRLVINGRIEKLSARNLLPTCTRQIVAALARAERSAKRTRRTDVNGVLRVNSTVRVYKRSHDLLVARSDAEQLVSAARRGAADPAAAAKAKDAIAKVSGKQPFGIHDARPIAAAMLNRTMEPMANAMASMIPGLPVIPARTAETPRLQRLNDLQLKQQLMRLPELEIYRGDKEAIRMTNQLAKISRADAQSVPPRREPLFEILPVRPDLQGLPYLRGEQCRLPDNVRHATATMSRVSGTMGGSFLAMSIGMGAGPAQIPGLIQILQAKTPQERVALNQILLKIGTFESIQSLAKRAMFDTSMLAREFAIQGLQGEQASVRPTLLQGLRYPWAPVAAHAAETLVRLGDKEAIPSLIAMLDEPHPSAPEMVNGKWMTREVVRINHMKNCMLCHAPSTSLNDLMRARVPIPGNSRVTGPDPVAKYYGTKTTPGAFVRADITYLRQDFSVTTHTNELAPWPKQQRSDFIVRSRPVRAEEMLILNQRPLGRDYPQRQAVLFALQQLSGLDLGDDSAPWRAKLLAKK